MKKIESKVELKEIDIKNHACLCVYYISYKNCMGSVLLRIKFDEIHGFIKIYDGIRYLVLFGGGFYDEIFDRIKYLICKKSGITVSISHNFARIKIDSYYSLLIEKILTFHVMILIK